MPAEEPELFIPSSIAEGLEDDRVEGSIGTRGYEAFRLQFARLETATGDAVQRGAQWLGDVVINLRPNGDAVVGFIDNNTSELTMRDTTKIKPDSRIGVLGRLFATEAEIDELEHLQNLDPSVVGEEETARIDELQGLIHSREAVAAGLTGFATALVVVGFRLRRKTSP